MKIHATFTKTHTAVFESKLNDGSCYIIQNLVVVKNDSKFRVIDNKYKLHFMSSTKCILTQSPAIPINSFNFVDFATIFGGLDDKNLIGLYVLIQHVFVLITSVCLTNCFCDSLTVDVLGHVVKKSDLKETEKSNKLLDIVLEDLE